MSLQVWLPLNGDLHNQGLSNITVINNGATVDNNGKIGKCYSFDRTIPNYLRIPTPFTTFTGISFAFWIKIPANASGNNQIIHIGNGSGWTTNRCTCFVRNGRSAIVFCCGDGVDTSTTHSTQYGCMSSNLALNIWTHVACIYSPGNLKIYLNGILDKTYNTSIIPILTGISNCGIGAAPNGQEPWTGYLNDVRIYDHALSPKEVEEIAKGLVLHYKLDNNGMGGDNLALNTRKLDIASSNANLYMYHRGASTLQLRNNGFYEVKCTAAWQGLSFWANQLNLSVGTKVTYSFYIYGNGSSRAFSFYPMMYNSAGTRDTSTGLPISIDGGTYTTANAKAFANTTATSSEYHYVTFEWNQAVANIITNGGSIELSIQVHGTWNSGDWACIFAPKVEIGDKPTAWSPAKSELGDMATTVYDCSGYSNNGTIVGSLTAAADSPRYDVATQFNGTSSYIEAEPLPSETVTISAWVKFKTLPGSYKIILHDKFTGLAIGLTSTYRLITYVGSTNGGTGSQAQLPTLSTNTWYHIVVIKTGDTTRDVYFNGKQVTNLSKNYWGGDLDKFTIGGRHISGAYSNFFDGQISDVRVYTTTLTSTQIKELYNTSMSIDSNGNVYARELVEL